MPVIDHFGLLAPLYDRFIPPKNPEMLIKLAGLPVQGPVLDAGGGTGRVSRFIRKLAAQVVVADLSIGMLRQAPANSGLDQVCSATELLPFPDEAFDRVIMVDALHHVASQAETAGELWRVVRPGGRIVIEEPDIRLLVVKLVAAAEKMALMRSHFLAPARIAALFTYPRARTGIERERWNAWVVVEKTAG